MKIAHRQIPSTVALVISSNSIANRRRACSFFRECSGRPDVAVYHIDSFRPKWREDLRKLTECIHLDSIVTSTFEKDELCQITARFRPRPKMLIIDQPKVPRGHPLHIDDAAIGRTAAEFLVSRNYCHLAYVGANDEFFGTTHSQKRERSFKATAMASGASYDGAYQITGGQLFDPQFLDFLNRIPKPCGIFAYNDTVAHDILNFCRSHDIAVPDAVAILGADDYADLCEASAPSLSSVVIDFDTAGCYACRRVIDDLAATATMPKAAAPYVHERDSTLPTHSYGRIVNLAKALISQRKGCVKVSEIAALTHVSARTLQLGFEKILGHGPKQEILAYRLAQAKTLLKTTLQPIGKIAAASGFASVSNFHHNFTAAFGISPSEYRMNGQS